MVSSPSLFHPTRLRLLSLVCCVCCALFALPLRAADQKQTIIRAADQILAHQAEDGAIVLGAPRAASSRVVPYFANSAAIGLAVAFQQTGDKRYIHAARNWVRWYEAHMNTDGTICDYVGRSGSWKSTGDYDSSDSYAATYLELLQVVYESSGNQEWLKQRLPSARKAHSAIRLTLKPNGLTAAKPNFPMMYVMDNTETLRGLRALVRIAETFGESALASEARQAAINMEQGIDRELWNETTSAYSVGIQTDMPPAPNFGRWYPDTMANLMAAGWLPFSFKHRDLIGRMLQEQRSSVPGRVTSERDLERLVWWGFAAKGVGNRELLSTVCGTLKEFDLQVKTFSNPALLGHAIRLLSGSNDARATPASGLRAEYDVVIAGAGTGGFGAAMQAARLGASVLLVEETEYIGGQMNAAAVTSMDEGSKHKNRPYVLVRERGIYNEFFDEVNAHYRAKGMSSETAYWEARLGLEPRVGQDILYAMLNTARAHTPALHVCLRSKVTRVLKHGNLVTGVTLETETAHGNRTCQIKSKVLIDATEWGDVLPLTGAAYRVGNCTNGAVVLDRAIQDLTWTAVVKEYPSGVPSELLLTQPPPGYDKGHTRFLKGLVAEGKIDTQKKPWSFATFIGYRGMPNSEQPEAREITRTHLNYNNDFPVTIRDVEDMACRETTCRNAQLRTLQLLYYIQNAIGKTNWSVANDEGYDSPSNRARVDAWIKDQPDLAPFRAVLYQFPPMPYARESRRMIGLHTLTARDIERNPGSPKMFETSVALGDYPVDLHGSKKHDLLELHLETMADVPKGFGDRGIGPFSVPFECFIPVQLDGFVPSEKNISQSRLANGATRLQPSTMLIGQAAGAIAGLAVHYGVQPRDLDSALVQQVLLKAGDTLHITPFMDVPKSGWEWPAIQLVTVRGLMSLTNANFVPNAPLSADVFRQMVQKLFQTETSSPDPVSRAEFIRVLKPLMAGQGVTLQTGAALKDSSSPITRLETARVLAEFLYLRGLSRVTGQPQVLTWAAFRQPSPFSAEMISSLYADLNLLAALGIIQSPEYWVMHAREGATCDGEKVADLLKRFAKAVDPASPEAQFLEVCASEHLFRSPDYWKQLAVEGRQCSGVFVASLIQRAAQTLAKRK